jgi:hypothetical protein
MKIVISKNDSYSIGSTCSGFIDIPSGDEKALVDAVATIGPVRESS